MNDGAMKVRDKSVMEQIIAEIEVGNKVFADLTHKLEAMCNKMEDQSDNISKQALSPGGDKPAPSLPGHLTTIKNTIEHTRSLNARLSLVVDKFEKII